LNSSCYHVLLLHAGHVLRKPGSSLTKISAHLALNITSHDIITLAQEHSHVILALILVRLAYGTHQGLLYTSRKSSKELGCNWHFSQSPTKESTNYPPAIPDIVLPVASILKVAGSERSEVCRHWLPTYRPTAFAWPSIVAWLGPRR
jgi:hypothetical protein